MWFKNLRIFRLNPAWKTDTAQLEDVLSQHAFQPGTSQDPSSLGWVPPQENGALVHELNGQLLLSVRFEKKLLPSTVVNQVTRAKAKDLEAEQGYKVGRKQMRELKEDVITELLPKAFSIQRDTSIWIDPINHWLVIDAAAAATADEIMGLIAKTLDPFPVLPLYTEQSPAAAMTAWLVADEAPVNFTIDQDTELRSTSESRAVVRYVRHSVDIEEVRKHIEQGKQCTRLALTWADKLSFVLTDGLEVKRLAPLDILTEQADTALVNEEESFNSDFAIMSAELNQMLNDLVAALGGEKADT
ncbi:MAG TPA: recombination-associated protein RdgC [Candidatus Paenalcaligenes intestinipullorum]|uniref:Recombination-associated protein RdgC n=1 Tax=Candidatus Paenalcaligenes intestinipullorum TaxID=2838718 RepID=A0A9D2RIN4_9BURK|nr:recombination-associated protein RdgC [Candidatus Paenalcaligenes intestinipullorum]